MIDISKPYRTQGGIELVHFNRGSWVVGDYKISGQIGNSKTTHWWTENGEHYSNLPNMRLVPLNKKSKTFLWANVYNTGNAFTHESREIADSNSGEGRIACVKILIEYEEGEGL